MSRLGMPAWVLTIIRGNFGKPSTVVRHGLKSVLFRGGTVGEIQIISQEKIYVRGSNGINVTEDGGATWSATGIGFPPRFHFFDALRGYGINPDNNNVYKTEDGGQNWEV